MNIELKPCPFCGHAGEMFHSRLTGRYYGYCPNCCADGPGYHETEEEAAKSWNWRYTENEH